MFMTTVVVRPSARRLRPRPSASRGRARASASASSPGHEREHEHRFRIGYLSVSQPPSLSAPRRSRCPLRTALTFQLHVFAACTPVRSLAHLPYLFFATPIALEIEKHNLTSLVLCISLPVSFRVFVAAARRSPP